MKAVVVVAEYVGIAAGIAGSVTISTLAGRPDLLIFTFLMTYLIVSLLTPAQRHRPQPLARARAAVGGTAGGGPTNSRRFESEGLGAAG